MTMKKSIYTLLALALLLTSCDSWVENAGTPSNTLTKEQLNKSAMIAIVQTNTISDGPLTAYVKTLQGDAASAAFLALGTTVDELTEGTIPNALLYRQIATDNLTPTSGTQSDLWNKIHNYYARSVELSEIAGQITGANAEQTEIIKAYGKYVGHLHAGYALQLLAESFSTTPAAEGGSVILNKTVVSHETMLNQAKEQYEAAMKEVQSDALKNYRGFDNEAASRQIKTYELKLAMHLGQYAEAKSLIGDALKDGESVEVIYNNDGTDNPLYSAIGPNSRDVQVSPSLEATRTTDAEKKALPLAHASVDKKNPNRYNIYASALTRKGTLTISDENDIHLVKAELIVRGVMTGDALTEVNKVIGKYDTASQLSTVPTLPQIAALRRIFLAFRGERTADIRRGLEQGTAATTWSNRKIKWLPMPEKELQSQGL